MAVNDIGSEGAMLIMQKREEQLRGDVGVVVVSNTRLQNLVLAGAAIAAEIDMLIEGDDNASS